MGLVQITRPDQGQVRFKSAKKTVTIIQAHQPAGERMVSIIIQRLARERQNSQSVVQNEVEEDLRPDFLKQFPNAAEMYKDMKLGVLLGR